MQNLKNKSMLFSVAILLCLVMTGCDSSRTTVSTNQINQREYTLAVSVEDSHVLDIQCRYLGKTPPASAPKLSADKRPDYYEIKITNRSNVPVSLESVEHSMRTGPYRGKSFFNQDALKKTWTDTLISPGNSIVRGSNFVWAVKARNALIKKYSFVMMGSEGDVSFSVTSPLEYQR
tara:strand:- start:1469 stop:1996 length:528 start_codon:yes stop_codon:yes gene_type:complete